MKKLAYAFMGTTIAVMVSLFLATPAWAPPKGGSGSAASSKAVFSNNPTGVTFLPFGATLACGDTGVDDPSDMLCTDWVTLFDLPDALKTSSVGALEAVLSMECSLWTDSEASAMIGTTGAGGSRAGIEVKVTIDGGVMAPGQVVYCDRLQYISLTIPELFVTVGGALPVFSNDPFVVGLFQRTKNAHAYHFYLPTPATDLHAILVEARGIVQCFKDGAPANCTDSGIDIPKLIGEAGEGGTKAVIGKSTLVVEEHNNWRLMDDGV